MLTRHIAHMNTGSAFGDERALNDASRQAEQILGTLTAAGLHIINLDEA